MTTPLVRLDIRGTSNTVGATIQLTGNGVSTLILGQDADGGVIRGQGGTSKLRFLVGGSGDTSAATGGTEVLRLASGAITATGTLAVSGATTLGGALIASATDTHDIGSSTRFRNIFGQAVNTASLEVANGTTVTTFWRHTLNSASAYDILSGSGSQLEMRLETLSSTNSGAGFRGTLYPLSTSGSNGDLGYSGTPWRSLFLSTGFRLTAGAAAGRVLTSDASGNGTWVAPTSSGTVTSIATTSPISGGTITTTGTISCPTCYTTAGGTISGNAVVTGTLAVNSTLSTVGITFAGNVLPNLDSTWEIGSASQRVAGLFYNSADTYGSHRIRNGANISVLSGGSIFADPGSTVDFSGTVTTGGAAVATATYSCGSGEAIKTLTVSRGLVTAATCGTP